MRRAANKGGGFRERKDRGEKEKTEADKNEGFRSKFSAGNGRADRRGIGGG